MIWPAAPPGFIRRVDGPRALYAAESEVAELAARGFDRPETWDRALAGGIASQGRGSTFVLARASGPSWRLKRMRRGGRLAALWRDRYPGSSRLVRILAVSAEARHRGVPGARPVGLLLVSGPGPLVRGWMVFEEIAGAESLADRLRRGALSREDLGAALAVVRSLHDAGIVHPDLNLGNVLVRSRGGAVQAFVIDLDRGRSGRRPAGIALRKAALRRLQRSCAKLSGSPGPLGPGSETLWSLLYAGEDSGLARRLERGRSLGAVSLAWHRLGWRKDGS